MTLALGRTPIVGHDNVLTKSGVTITQSAGTVAAFPIANAYDGKTTTLWGQTSATTFIKADAGSGNTYAVDYLCIAVHTLKTAGASVVLQSSTDNSTWADRSRTFTPSADNELICDVFPSASARYWRVNVTSVTGTVYIGVIMFGQRTEFPAPVSGSFTPPKFGHDDDIQQSITEGGQFAGASVLVTRYTCPVMIDLIPTAWFESNWSTLYAAMRAKPFLFWWDVDGHQNDPSLMWLRKGQPPKITYSKQHWYKLEIELEGIV